MESDTRAAVGRRLTPKGEATRARIVGAAAELIARNGIAGTSNEAVRRAAGVSGSQLAAHFSDKGSLVCAVIGHQRAAVLGAMRHPAVGQIETLAGLRMWADSVVASQDAAGCERGCRYGALAGQLIDADPATRAQLADGFTQWQSEFRRALDAIVARGELAPDAPTDRLAHCLLAALQGGLLLSHTSRSTAPLEAALDAAIAHAGSYTVAA